MNYILNLNIIEQVVLGVFLITLLIQLFYYLYYYLRIARYKPVSGEAKKMSPVSIVICAKNEAAQLEKFLPRVLEQDYPDFEVIVVNDGSDDGSEDILKLLSNRYSKLYVTAIPQSRTSGYKKKLAVSIGLKAAKNDWVLLTDADCEPVSNQWLKSMQSHFEEKADFVIGYGGFYPAKGFLNKIIRYDTLTIAMQYISYALAKNPYMGVGRNLAYRKSVFFNNRGFASHLHLASGDDDLFINENATKSNLKVSLQPESFTRSIAKKRFKSWFYQKKRHLSTAKYYKRKHKFSLGNEVFSRMFLYASFITAMFFPPIMFIVLGGFLLRLLVQYIILFQTAKKLCEKNIFYLGIIFDLFIPIINFMVHFSNLKLRKRKK